MQSHNASSLRNRVSMTTREPSNQPRIGFIGLGDMGGPIAKRIAAAGFPLSVWSRRLESLQELGSEPYRAVDSIFELGHRCDILGTCVFNDSDVRDVAL